MSLFDNFTTFNFEEGVPYVSVTKNGVTFNKAVIMKMNYPEHVRLLINAESQQFAIQVCDESTENSTTFYKTKSKSKVLSVRWNAKDLLNTIEKITGWKLETESYRINGTQIPEENAMLFDLSKAISLS